MSDVNRLNDPEYRWYHQDEMAKIMPFSSERARLGIIVIDYNKLRDDNDAKIKVQTVHDLDWTKFKGLIDRIPYGAMNSSQKKETLQPKDRLHFEMRDKGVCYLCGSVYRYGSCNIYAYADTNYKMCHLHHVVPNGNVTDENIITLCTHCHQMVHQVMYVAGKWKYGRPL